MTEPELTYVRGKGWVYETRKQYPSKKHGPVYIELRKPNPGELCCWVDNEYEHTIEQWADWISSSRGYSYKTLEYELEKPEALWCTFIPVDGRGDEGGL